MNRVMSISNVTALIAQCWGRAEAATREQLAKRHFDQDEEFITKLFHGEFRGTLEAATRAGAVEQAFLKDLKRHLPNIRSPGDLGQLASGISATVTLHPREVEKETGGDLGLVLIRPNLNFQNPPDAKLIVDEHHRRGLLCQAKIKRRSSGDRGTHWGGFTRNQRSGLVDRTGYLALLLYEYRDAQRRILLPFRWQLCGGKKLDVVEGWLRTGAFPDLSTSETIIRLLGDDRIGTGDKAIIDQLIAPAVRDALVIRIGWPLGRSPSQSFLLRRLMHQNQSPPVFKQVAR